MPRADHRLGGETLRIWVVEVDDAHRIRVDRDIYGMVSWLTPGPEPIECTGMPGPMGGLQVEPLAAHEDDLRRFRAALGASLPAARESGQGWMDVARLLATAWRMTVNREPSRISVTLPEPARQSLLVPQAGGTAVVFGCGAVLEIWDAADWHAHGRATAARRAAAMSKALEDLERR
jgi:hypothetical protein